MKSAAARSLTAQSFVPSLRKHLVFATGLCVTVALALLPLQVSVLLLLGTALCVATAARPLIALAAVALLVPFGSLFTLNVGEIAITATDITVGVLVIGWILLLLSRRESVVAWAWPLWSIVLFIGLIALDLTLEPVVTVGLKELLRWAELLLVALAGANLMRQRRDIWIVVGAMVAAATIESVIGFYQFLFRAGPAAFALGPFLRAFGTFGQPNPFAGYLIMVFPLALGPALGWKLLRATGIPRIMAIGGAAAATVILLAIVFSFSRGAWLGLAAAAFLLICLVRRRFVTALPASIGLLGLAALAYQLGLMPATLQSRVADSLSYFGLFDVRTVEATAQNWALVERMASWQAAWGMFESSPVLGIGPGRFDDVYQLFAVGGWLQPLGHAHNFYLNTLAEMGAVGLAAYVAIIGGWFILGLTIWRRMGQRCGPYPMLVLSILTSLTAVAMHNFFDDLYVKGLNVQMGLLIGLLLAVQRQVPPQEIAQDGEV